MDIYIPTYNEDPEILRPTVIAATQMRYPRHKLHVYVLDDGGTAQKLCDKDPAKAAAMFKMAAQSSDEGYAALGSLHYATALYEGNGVDRDEAEARKWFERSAQGGFAKANEEIGRLRE